MQYGFKRARILSYDSSTRTAKVHIFGLTDGASDGLTATFAYAVGEDDRDTELKILSSSSNLPDVYVFFEGGDEARPVIAFFSSHGSDNVTDVRRIRQKNIEILATSKATIEAPDIYITGSNTVNITGTTQVNVSSETKVSVKAPQVSINGG